MATLLDEWLGERQSDGDLSAHTAAVYRNDLRVLAERIAGLGEIPALQQLTPAALSTAAVRGVLADLAREDHRNQESDPVDDPLVLPLAAPSGL